MAKKPRPLMQGIHGIMIQDVPSYANKFFYSLGFLSMISFILLLVTGTIMAFFGPGWWLTNSLGSYTRSVHLWATQAFVLFVLLHLMVVTFTSGYRRPRRLTWMLGVLMLFLVLAETEFGYVLRGDFSSQWRSLQGADFYNGAGLGNYINALSYQQIYGIHVVVIPLAVMALLFFHYLLVRVLGIAKPYRKDVEKPTVPANHTALFLRGGSLIGLVLALALFVPSPYIKPSTIQSVAQEDPILVQKTLVSEMDKTSDTATYLDNIDPYTFDTVAVFITKPYGQYVQSSGKPDQLSQFSAEPPAIQTSQLKAAEDYLGQDKPDPKKAPNTPVMSVTAALTAMAAAGLYEPALTAQTGSKFAASTTYPTRFLSDTGILEDQATKLGVTTQQYGMIREETGHAPGAWWLSPIGLLNHTLLAKDDNGDRDAAIIFGSLLLTMLAFPFIPFVNQIPDKLRLYKLFWR
jgi:ubiquinol-cytochrome c reductase cytochrome b subunit